MKLRLRAFGALLLAFCAHANVRANDPALPAEAPRFETAFVRLLQPEWLISERTSAEELAKTIKAVTADVEHWSVAQAKGRDANACVIFLALRPRQRLKTWTVCAGDSAPDDASALDARIVANVAGSDIAEVRGLILLSIHGRSAGDAFPSSWAAAAAGESVEVGELVDRVWPDREP